MKALTHSFWILFVVALSSSRLFAEGAPFRISSIGMEVPAEGGQAVMIAQLKQKAVVQWLQNSLKERFPAIEKHIGKDFGEKYISDYKVGRLAEDKTKIEIVGTIDSRGLQGWLNLLDTRARGNSAVTPLLILSSSAPGLTLGPNETPARASDSQLGQALVALTNPILQKFNGRLVVGEVSTSATEPPRSERDVREVSGVLGRRGQILGLWYHLSPCKTCGGYRLDTHLLQLAQGRRVMARSDDLALGPSDLSNGAKIRAALKQPFTELQAELDGLVSSGSLTGRPYTLTFESVPSYDVYKSVEKQVASLEYLVDPTFAAAGSGAFSVETLSSLDAEELMQRITSQVYTGFSLKRVSVDSRKLVVRYSR